MGALRILGPINENKVCQLPWRRLCTSPSVSLSLFRHLQPSTCLDFVPQVLDKQYESANLCGKPLRTKAAKKKKRKKENLQALLLLLLLLLLWNALIVTLNVTVLAALVAANLHNVDKVQACRGGDRSGVRVGLLKPELFHSISPSAMGITICSHQISLETWHCKEVKAKVFIP